MNTIHIFYNGTDTVFGENNDWEKFRNPDSVRLFLACAESWRRNGWEVRRVSTVDRDVFTPLIFAGRIAKEGRWYPAPFWQFIAKAVSLPLTGHNYDGTCDEFVFGTYDVFNYGLSPYQIGCGSSFDEAGCVSYQRDHFSMSLIRCNRRWLARALEILKDYDNGKLPRIPGKYVSDETILRAYAQYSLCPIQAFPVHPTAHECPLIHFGRSSLHGAFEKIPCV